VLVVDASVAVSACLAPPGFAVLGDEDLVAPPILWSETLSALHELVRRGHADPADGEQGRAILARSPIERREHERLADEAWRIADGFGWAKTYDAEYLALAGLLGCRLVTLDGRLVRATRRLGFVVSPAEL
jgi:predicted nucleic acid-binding protein